MAGKIRIDTELCKGCGLCVVVCPKKNIVISKKLNKSGYFPAVVRPLRLAPVSPSACRGGQGRQAHQKNPPEAECTGCCFCALICPDAAIEVCREDNVVAIGPGKGKGKSSFLQKQESKK